MKLQGGNDDAQWLGWSQTEDSSAGTVPSVSHGSLSETAAFTLFWHFMLVVSKMDKLLIVFRMIFFSFVTVFNHALRLYL